MCGWTLSSYWLWSSSMRSYPQSVPFCSVLECLISLPSSHSHSYTLALGFKGPLGRKLEPQSFYVLGILKVTGSSHRSVLCLCLHNDIHQGSNVTASQKEWQGFCLTTSIQIKSQLSVTYTKHPRPSIYKEGQFHLITLWEVSERDR